MRKKGMLLKGPSHKNGGIPGKIKETGQPIEVEGDEMIINKRSTRIKDHIVCRGTGEGIGSALNELGGGKKWSDEGKCEIAKFNKGNKMPKISSKQARDYVARTAPFKGDRHILAENVKGSYVVYSYGYYPLLVFKNGQWYENKEKYSRTTSKQLSQSRPSGISPEYKTTSELEDLIGEKRTQGSHFYEDGGKIIYNVTYFDEDGNEIDSTQIDEKDEELAWELFKEFGHTKGEGTYLELEEGVEEYKKGKKISSHINKRKNENIRNIQRMVIRDGNLKKAEYGEMVELNREDKLIKINRPQDFAIVSFLKRGSYPSNLKVFKYGDSICIYKNDPELVEFLNKYKIAYSEFDNYEEFYNWLTNKLTTSTKNKL